MNTTESTHNSYKSCILCPRACKADRASGRIGFCRCTDEVRINLTMLHHGEEPILAHSGGAGAVFFEGCGLHCIFCQNETISRGPTISGKTYSAKELAEEYIRLQNIGAEIIDLVTFMHFAPTVADSIRIAKAMGLSIPVAANISGYDSIDTLRMLDGLIDIYLPDFKFYSSRLSQKLCGASDYFDICSSAIREMYRQTGPARLSSDGLLKKGVIVRHLMLPGQLIDTKNILNHLTDTYGNNIYISLMNQYTPMPFVVDGDYPDYLKRELSDSAYNSAVRLLTDKNQENAFVQEKASSGLAMLPDFKT